MRTARVYLHTPREVIPLPRKTEFLCIDLDSIIISTDEDEFRDICYYVFYQISAGDLVPANTKFIGLFEEKLLFVSGGEGMSIEETLQNELKELRREQDILRKSIPLCTGKILENLEANLKSNISRIAELESESIHVRH